METALFAIACDRLRSYGNQPLEIIHVINFYIRDTQLIYTTIAIVIIIIIIIIINIIIITIISLKLRVLFSPMYAAKFNHELRAVISLLDYLMMMMMMMMIIIIIKWNHDSSWVLYLNTVKKSFV